MLQGGVYKSKGQFQSVDFDTITRVIQKKMSPVKSENIKCEKNTEKMVENAQK